MLTGRLVVIAPELSVARAVSGLGAGGACSIGVGALVSSPSFVPRFKNSTCSRLPSGSAPVAVSEIFAGEATMAPFGGEVSDAVGAGSTAVVVPQPQAPSVTIFATDGTPAESTMKSM
jgi:hypothetical protein